MRSLSGFCQVQGLKLVHHKGGFRKTMLSNVRELLGKGMLVIAVAGLVIALAPVETAAAASFSDNQTCITTNHHDGGDKTPPPAKPLKGGGTTGGAGDDDG